MLAASLAPVVLGVANFVQKSVLTDPGPLENRIEWVTTVLMQAWFLFLYWYMRERDVNRPERITVDTL